MANIIEKWTQTSLILKIVIGIIIGTILGIFLPKLSAIGLLGTLFVSALKAIAPILVFVLVTSAISKAKTGIGSRFKTVIYLYFFSTFFAALVAIIGSYLFPVSIPLSNVASASVAAPEGLYEIISNMLLKIFENPLHSLVEGDYLSILFWSIVIGAALNSVANDTTKDVLSDIADAITKVVWSIIQFAPIGILGLVFTSVSQSGIGIFTQYGELILLLVGCIAFVMFIVNPMLTFITLKRNPYPLVFTCLKESGLTAFFSRSSAANIPVNMNLCERLGLDKDFYSISIPLGSTINTGGAAITITVMSLAVCHTLGIQVALPLTLILCLISILGACGASGIAGGSLLLVPMACSLFGISNDIAMQAVAVGFIIGVIQDSCETALNSSGDALFSATAEYRDREKNGEPVNYLGEFAKD
ncbi:serine/threonine protein kinase [Methanobrevibacter sp. YE315]|uniref:serine/threonine transporter SstT n=1 Tax=Methanobrevibacter sp. YE315 TaxID=1609968 RepID=UPI000764EB41|nr:serine/threonine transporter SstT [Methanobrevibacter sp. YE315]AMD17314.1 serine/threonine protein kinase [Methanobrevibacter sp. YE315]